MEAHTPRELAEKHGIAPSEALRHFKAAGIYPPAAHRLHGLSSRDIASAWCVSLGLVSRWRKATANTAPAPATPFTREEMQQHTPRTLAKRYGLPDNEIRQAYKHAGLWPPAPERLRGMKQATIAAEWLVGIGAVQRWRRSACKQPTTDTRLNYVALAYAVPPRSPATSSANVVCLATCCSSRQLMCRRNAIGPSAK